MRVINLTGSSLARRLATMPKAQPPKNKCLRAAHKLAFDKLEKIAKVGKVSVKDRRICQNHVPVSA